MYKPKLFKIVSMKLTDSKVSFLRVAMGFALDRLLNVFARNILIRLERRPQLCVAARAQD